jgi:hypothetical protein
MRKTNSSIPAFIIAFLCIAVYVAALIIGAYRLYVNVTGRRAIAEREFYNLTDLASAAGVLGFMAVPFQEAIQDSLTESQTLEGVIISGPSGEYAFERDPGEIIRWEGDSPRFVNRFGLSSTLVRPLNINGLRNVNISVGFRWIDYNYGITILKHSLMVILAALTAAFLTFLVESILGREPASAKGTQRGAGRKDDELEPFEPAGRMAKKSEQAVSLSSHEDTALETPDAWGKESLDFPDLELGPDFTSDLDDSDEDFDIPEVDFSLDDPLEETPAEPAIPDSAAAEDDVQPSPQGLYAPGSNIGWEEYTGDRLKSELHRCAASEEDLTVLLVDFSGKAELTSQQYNQLAEMAVNFFNLRDLMFEKGKQGITIILPNTDLEQGFSRAEEFLSYLTPAFTDTPGFFRIGVSSRAGRLVDADRLYFEAAEALDKAVRDPVSPIIAFKCDPEKYRAFLRSRGKDA